MRLRLAFLFAFLSLAFCTLCTFTACSKTEPLEFRANGDDALSYIPGVTWAVIAEPLAAFRAEASFESAVQAHARRGDVFPVHGSALVSGKDSAGKKVQIVWYRFENGWLDQTVVFLYDNEMQAERAAERLLSVEPH